MMSTLAFEVRYDKPTIAMASQIIAAKRASGHIKGAPSIDDWAAAFERVVRDMGGLDRIKASDESMSAQDWDASTRRAIADRVKTQAAEIAALHDRNLALHRECEAIVNDSMASREKFRLDLGVMTDSYEGQRRNTIAFLRERDEARAEVVELRKTLTLARKTNEDIIGCFNADEAANAALRAQMLSDQGRHNDEAARLRGALTDLDAMIFDDDQVIESACLFRRHIHEALFPASVKEPTKPLRGAETCEAAKFENTENGTSPLTVAVSARAVMAGPEQIRTCETCRWQGYSPAVCAACQRCGLYNWTPKTTASKEGGE